jgi:serine/threonine-protein kinase HipA
MSEPGKNDTLHVYMNGYRVGALCRYAGGGLTFAYARDWLATRGARPVSLSLPLRKEPYLGDEVYNFFDNLLPDNPAIRARIQTRFKCATDRPFDLLAQVGGDCVGAMQLVGSSEAPDVKRVQADPLNEAEVAELLRNYRQAPLGMAPGTDDFRISLAGAQEKTALLKYKNGWWRPKGATPTSHIFKPPIGKLEASGMDFSDSCENEWLCHRIARAFGLQTARSEVLTFEDQKALVVERFDRKWSQDGTWLMRLPTEDTCQALGVSPQLRYESDGGPGIASIMDLLLGSESAREDRDIFIKAQILFWLLAATDGHAKNFSLFLLPGGAFRLAPLYDIMTVYPLIAGQQLPMQKARLAMALYGQNRHANLNWIQPRHWFTTAAKIRYSKELTRQYLNEMCAQIDTVIETVANGLPPGFPPALAEQVFEGMRNTRDVHLPAIENL